MISTTRVKVPFGIAQVGKSFRNEINPRNFTFRSREFEQMEMEFFASPALTTTGSKVGRNPQALVHRSRSVRQKSSGCATTKSSRTTRKRPPTSNTCSPFGWGELEGIANRTDFDLRQHQRGVRTVGKWDGGDLAAVELAAEDAEYQRAKLSYFDDEKKQRYVPYVIEPAAGADRATLAFCATPTPKTAPRCQRPG